MGKDVGEALQDAAFTRTRLHGSTIEASYSGALSFLRRKYTKDLTGVDVAITGIPFDLSVSNRPGTRFGPEAIRRASAQHSWGRSGLGVLTRLIRWRPSTMAMSPLTGARRWTFPHLLRPILPR